MKNYYIHNGSEQEGPFDVQRLKTLGIKKDTPIWYDGLSEWTTAGNVEELREFTNSSAPPPFVSNKPSSLNTPKNQKLEFELPAIQKKSILSSFRFWVGLVIVGLLAVFAFSNYNRLKSGGTSSSYQEKVMTVEEIEQSQPVSFLTADGKYNKSFWGDKFKVHGVIKNMATVATYKDAIVRVTYYSKTKTVLTSNEYTIFEVFPPHSETKFELSIENYKNVNSIGWDVIQAKVN